MSWGGRGRVWEGGGRGGVGCVSYIWTSVEFLCIYIMCPTACIHVRMYIQLTCTSTLKCSTSLEISMVCMLCPFTYTHTHSLSLSHTHTHTLSLSHTHTLLSHTHTHTHTLTHTHSHTHTLSHTHTHTHTLSLSHTHTHTHRWADMIYSKGYNPKPPHLFIHPYFQVSDTSHPFSPPIHMHTCSILPAMYVFNLMC